MRRQQQGIKAIQTLLITSVSPTLSMAGDKKSFICDRRDFTSGFYPFFVLAQQSLPYTAFSKLNFDGFRYRGVKSLIHKLFFPSFRSSVVSDQIERECLLNIFPLEHPFANKLNSQNNVIELLAA